MIDLFISSPHLTQRMSTHDMRCLLAACEFFRTREYELQRIQRRRRRKQRAKIASCETIFYVVCGVRMSIKRKCFFHTSFRNITIHLKHESRRDYCFDDQFTISYNKKERADVKSRSFISRCEGVWDDEIEDEEKSSGDSVNRKIHLQFLPLLHLCSSAIQWISMKLETLITQTAAVIVFNTASTCSTRPETLNSAHSHFLNLIS